MAPSSPPSDVSSLSSFVTAHGSIAAKSTAASSPMQDNPCPYRDPRHLPRDLKIHCQIFLEEQLCMYTLGVVTCRRTDSSSL